VSRFVLFRGIVFNVDSISFATYEPGPDGAGITKIFLGNRDATAMVPGDVREELLAALHAQGERGAPGGAS
jgi:hypothetical protein